MGTKPLSYEERDCFLSHMVPAFKLLYLVLFSIIISTAGDVEIYIYLIFLLMVGAICKISIGKALLSMPFMLIIALFIAITEWINTKEILQTLSETISFLSLLIIAILFMATTDITELAASLGHYTSPIVGKQAWKLSSSIMLTIAMLPMIFEVSTTMLQARRARCGSFLSHPIRNITEYTISLILLLFKKAEIFEDALLSRAFSDTAERKTKNARPCDIITLVCIVLLTISIFIARKAI